MRLKWVKVPGSMHTFRAESVRYRYVIVAPTRATDVMLWVQSVNSEWSTNAIDYVKCRTKRNAERMAQRFEDNPRARKLR